jgi:hypothetical protein
MKVRKVFWVIIVVQPAIAREIVWEFHQKQKGMCEKIGVQIQEVFQASESGIGLETDVARLEAALQAAA